VMFIDNQWLGWCDDVQVLEQLTPQRAAFGEKVSTTGNFSLGNKLCAILIMA